MKIKELIPNACIITLVLLSMLSMQAYAFMHERNFAELGAGVNVTIHIRDYRNNSLVKEWLVCTPSVTLNRNISGSGTDISLNLTSYGNYNVTITYCGLIVYQGAVSIVSNEVFLPANITSFTVNVYTNDTHRRLLENYEVNVYIKSNGGTVVFKPSNRVKYLPFGKFKYSIVYQAAGGMFSVSNEFIADASHANLDIVLPLLSNVVLVFKSLNGFSLAGFNVTVSIYYGEKMVASLQSLPENGLSLSQVQIGTYRVVATYRNKAILDKNVQINNQSVSITIPVYVNVNVKVTTIDYKPLYSQDFSFVLTTPFGEAIPINPSPDGSFIISYGFPQDFGHYTLKIKSNVLNDFFCYDFSINSPAVDIQTNFRSSYLYLASQGSSRLPANVSVTLLYLGGTGQVVIKYVKTTSPIEGISEPLGFLPTNGRFQVVVEYSGYKWVYNLEGITQGKMNISIPIFDVQVNALDLDGKPLYDCFANLTLGRLSYVQQVSNGQALFRFIPSDNALLKVECHGLEVASLQLLPRQIEEGYVNVTARVKTFTVKVHGWFNKALPGANVTVKVSSGKNFFTRSSTTDAAGMAILRNIPIPLGSNITLTVDYGGIISQRNVYEGEPSADIFLDVFVEFAFIRLGLYQTLVLAVLLVLISGVTLLVIRRIRHIRMLKSMFQEAEYFEEEHEGFFQRMLSSFRRKREEEEKEEFDIFE